MDGFDDLLSTSRHPFHDNPFADPFDKPRPASPDPWSTFAQQEQVHGVYNAGFEHVQTTNELENDGYGRETQPMKGSHEERRIDAQDTSETKSASSTSVADETDARGTGFQSPGFRESIPPDDTEEQKETGPSLLSERRPADGVPSSSSGPSVKSTVPKEPASAVDQTQQFRTPTPTSSKHFVSPLESPGPGIVQAFASLALGGESTGGWQDTPSQYSIPTSPKAQDAGQSGGSVRSTFETGEDKGSSTADKEESVAKPLFSITVEDPQKVGDPIRSYILYTVYTKTNSPLFSKPSFSVLRRYSDFLWLYETLSLNNPGVIVPPVPEKNPFGRFDNLFVQQRRLALETCIQKMGNHPILAKDPDLRLFLESDTFALDIKHRKTDMAHDRGGILSSIGQTITGSRFSEVDDWFEKKKVYLDSLESQLKGLVKSIDSVSKQREELASAIGEFSLSVEELSESDLSKELCHSLATLASVEKKAQDLQHTQAQEDTITFMTTVEEYSRIIDSVRVAFASRVRCHSQWQNAESELRRVKQTYEKARNQGRISQERMGHALAQIAEAERRALDAKHDFDRASKLVKVECSRFEQERIADFKHALESFLEGMIQRQLELVKTWESYQEVPLNVKAVTSDSQDQPGRDTTSVSLL